MEAQVVSASLKVFGRKVKGKADTFARGERNPQDLTCCWGQLFACFFFLGSTEILAVAVGLKRALLVDHFLAEDEDWTQFIRLLHQVQSLWLSTNGF